MFDFLLVRVEDNAEVARLRFLGSPSFHVNGAELWPEQCDTHALNCRLYPTSQGIKGTPTVQMLQEKLRALNLTSD
jgi:hypothetical protein